MMVFPLPNAVLDVLLSCNVAFALCLLISSVYLLEPAKFTSLPTVLLLATLFRLGLNISTTRQVLTHGDAPEIVKAFGSFVVGGNLVVGAVIFAIVTLVQFLVIAKGAERVAEVAARFTLDAMPGKQMSIDADVRAGMISVAEAKDRRHGLQSESKLYGALDGAMKFVKGDAIAGLVITVVNILAGFIIGVTQHSMSFAEAARTYTLFTIGDGLVSQIPALLVAVAAGVAVTRVEDRDQAFVGRELLTQLGREPQALFTTALVMLMLAAVPGLPTLPFGLGGMGVMFLAWRGQKVVREREQQGESSFKPKVFSPIVVRVTPAVAQQLHKTGRIPQAIQELRSNIFSDWGVLVPELNFDLVEQNTEAICEIQIHGVTRAQLGEGETLEQRLAEVIAQNLTQFVDDTCTRTLLELHQPQVEDLINSLVPQAITVTGLTTLLRQLIRESVSIREMRTILQAVAEFHLAKSEGIFVPRLPSSRGSSLFRELRALGGANPPPAELREILGEVRLALSRTICQSLSGRDGKVQVWILAPATDHLLAQGTFAGTPLDPAVADSVLEQARRIADSEVRRGVVIVTSKYARLTCSELLMSELRDVRVVAADELTEDVQLEILGYLGGMEGEEMDGELAA